MGHTQKCVNCPISKNKNKNLSSVFVIISVLINKVLFKFIITRFFFSFLPQSGQKVQIDGKTGKDVYEVLND